MALKRKRSSPGFSSPSSDTTSTASADSNTGSLPFFYAQSKPIDTLYHKTTWSFPTYDDGAEQYRSMADMNSRTRKRHRDDRPEEEVVYCTDVPPDCFSRDLGLTCRLSANTISRLFSAQRQHPHAEPLPSHDTAPTPRPDQPQRSTLHSFWRIPKPAPAPAPAFDAPMTLDAPPFVPSRDLDMRCEDCDDPLRADHDMDLDEDSMAQETGCISCKRCVCDRCAVLGTARICLSCAGGHER